MTERVVAIVFDWAWNYLGHEFVMIAPEDVGRMPIGKRDSINVAITRRIAPDQSDVRTALCLIDEDGDLDVERATRELRDRHQRGDFDSRTETTLDADGKVAAYNVIKGRSK